MLPRFHPDARPLLVAGVEVLVAIGPALALQKAEALQTIIGKSRKLVSARVDQRAPNVLAFAIQDRKAIGIVHARRASSAR